MIASFFNALRMFGWWLVEQIFSMAEALLLMVTATTGLLVEMFVEQVGPVFNVEVSDVLPFFNIANFWVPLDLVFTCVLAELSITGLLVALRGLVRFIPKIGG